MGTDIHMRAEIKRNGQWEAVGEVFENPYYKADKPLNDWNKPLTAEPYGDRNYGLFAMLANVRNGYGFAGVVTGTGYAPIAEPRGLPEDMSPEVAEWMDSYDHTPSYLTLAELESYDWNQVTTRCGEVGRAGYMEWKENGRPSAWCGGSSGPKVYHVDHAAMDAIIAQLGVPERKHAFDDGEQGWAGGSGAYRTTVEWQESYADVAGSFLTDTLPKLRELAAADGVTDLRIVFYFDS